MPEWLNQEIKKPFHSLNFNISKRNVFLPVIDTKKAFYKFNDKNVYH